MSRFIFIEKSLYDGFNMAIKNEINNVSNISLTLPEYSLGDYIYYLFESDFESIKMTNLRFFKSYSEKACKDIIKKGDITYDKIVINYDLSRPAFSSKILVDGKKIFKRFHGSQSMNIDPGETQEYEVEIGYGHVKLEAIEIINAGPECTVDVYIEDTAIGSYSGVPNAILNQFVFSVNISEKYHMMKSQFDADLFLGMKIIIQVTNNYSSACRVGPNVELNEVV